MNRFRVYTVHIQPSLPEPYESAEFVEEGFSWKAFFFGPLFTLYHRLWWQTLILFLANVLLFQLSKTHSLTHMGMMVIQIGIQLMVGFEAYDWRRAALKHRGYITADVVTGDTLLRAEQRFYDRYFALQPTA